MLFATPSTLALTHAAWVTAVAQRIPLPLRILISIPIPILAQHLHQSLQRLGSPLLRPSRALQHIHHVGSVLGGGDEIDYAQLLSILHLSTSTVSHLCQCWGR